MLDNYNDLSSDAVYVLFYKHELTAKLSVDYRDNYARSFQTQENKIDLVKNILGQLLIKIDNLEEIFSLTGLVNTELVSLFNILQDSYYLCHLNVSSGNKDQLQI